MPTLAMEPESMESLQARYPKALEYTYHIANVAIGLGIRPGECRANVFDFDDGLRLIVSPENLGGGNVVLHVSASFDIRTGVGRDLAEVARRRGAPAAMEAFQRLCEGRFQALSGDMTPLEFLGFSGGAGIPHWQRPWAEGTGP